MDSKIKNNILMDNWYTLKPESVCERNSRIKKKKKLISVYTRCSRVKDKCFLESGQTISCSSSGAVRLSCTCDGRQIKTQTTACDVARRQFDCATPRPLFLYRDCCRSVVNAFTLAGPTQTLHTRYERRAFQKSGIFVESPGQLPERNIIYDTRVYLRVDVL